MDDMEAQEWGDIDDNDPSPSIEARIEREDEEGIGDTWMEAVEDGATYIPPEAPPVQPGGEDDAYMQVGDVPSAELLRDVLEALASNPNTSDLRLRIRVRRGIVTLGGPAPDALTAESAVSTVLAVEGVEDVIDRIEVAAP
jgi:hypothetical protein